MLGTRLSVLDLVADAYREVWRAPDVVVRLGLVAAIAGVLFVYISSAARSIVLESGQPTPLAIYLAHRAVVLAIIALIAVGWHRFILLGERPGSLRPTWTERHTRFWLWSLLFGFTAVLPGLVMSKSMSVPPYVLSFGGIVVAYFEARVALVLPAAAVASRGDVVRAWRLTAGNGIRLAVACAVVLLPVALIASPIFFVFPSLFTLANPEFHLVYTGLLIGGGWILLPFLTCVEVGVLSIAYRTLQTPAA